MIYVVIHILQNKHRLICQSTGKPTRFSAEKTAVYTRKNDLSFFHLFAPRLWWKCATVRHYHDSNVSVFAFGIERAWKDGRVNTYANPSSFQIRFTTPNGLCSSCGASTVLLRNGNWKKKTIPRARWDNTITYTASKTYIGNVSISSKQIFYLDKRKMYYFQKI